MASEMIALQAVSLEISIDIRIGTPARVSELKIRFDGGVQADRAVLVRQLIDQVLPFLVSPLAGDRDVQVVRTDCDRHGL